MRGLCCIHNEEQLDGYGSLGIKVEGRGGGSPRDPKPPAILTPVAHHHCVESASSDHLVLKAVARSSRSICGSMSRKEEQK